VGPGGGRDILPKHCYDLSGPQSIFVAHFLVLTKFHFY